MSKSPVTTTIQRLRVAGLALALFVLFVPCRLLAGNGTLLLNSNSTGATARIDSGGASYVGVHIWRSDSASASTSTAYLQVSIDGVAWYRAATFANVTGLDGSSGDGGDAVSVPSWPFMRLYVVNCDTGRLTAKWITR